MHISERNWCFRLSVTVLRLFINANLGDDIFHLVWSQLQGFDGSYTYNIFEGAKDSHVEITMRQFL